MSRDKLTAYALGELRGDAAREVETYLASHPEARRFVDETRAFSAFAERDLRAEPLPGGRGALPVLQEIAKRRRGQLPEHKVWLRAGLIALVLGLFVLAIPLRKRFGGDMAGGVPPHESVETDQDWSRRTGVETSAALDNEIEQLVARRRTVRALSFCRFSFPELASTDTAADDDKSVKVTYLLGESGTRIRLRLREVPPPLVHEEGVREVAKEGTFSFFRQLIGEREIAVFGVSERAQRPYCEARIELEGVAIARLAPLLEKLADTLGMGSR